MNFPSKKVMPRYMVFAVLFFLAGVAVVVKVGYLMTARRGFWMEVDKRFVREGDTLPATRGNILAANGEVLAASIPEYELYMDFMSYEKDTARRAREQFTRDSTLVASLDSICNGLAEAIPGTTPEQFRNRILEGRARGSHHWKIYSRRVSHVQYNRIKTLPVLRQSVGAGGFTAERFFKRKNPYGKIGLHTVGELYGGIDKPRSGLELSFDSLLKGTPGLAHRQRVFNTYASIVDKPAIDGCDVHTTMDINMQDIVEDALRDRLATLDDPRAAMCILMDVPTGDVKAMASLTKANDGNFYYMEHRALTQLLDPGSVFKPMSFLVAFDDGKLKPDDIVDAHGGVYMFHGIPLKDSGWQRGGPGKIKAYEAIERSSNVAVGTTIDRLYRSNPQAFLDGLHRIGVDEDLNLQIRGYAKPHINKPAPGELWSATALAWLSIGYESQLPPITTVTFYNGIANGGRMVRPRFVTHVTRGDEVVAEYPVTAIRERMAKPEAIANVQRCLSAVVKGAHATAKHARSKQFDVSGKTGTAQIWENKKLSGRHLVTFVGYFPSEAPQYTMIVSVEAGGSIYGGSTCGPVFKRIAETVMSQQRTDDLSTATDSTFSHTPAVTAGNTQAAWRVLGALNLSLPGTLHEDALPRWGAFSDVGPSMTCSPDTTADPGRMPDLTGYGLRDAVFRLESLGLHVKAKGVGHVGAQSVKAGSSVSRGDTIYIYLGAAAEPEQLADSLVAGELEAEAADSAAHATQPTQGDSSSRREATRQTAPAPAKPTDNAPAPERKAAAAATPTKPRKAVAQSTPAGKKPAQKPQPAKDKAVPAKKKK